jgi:RNA polymerase sigma-70 factor (ECF subfamily)
MRSDVEQAVELLQRGDDDALAKALELLQKSVFSFSMRVCGQQQDAEDTMQEVLIKSLPHLPKFTSSKALAVWLYKVARNSCLLSRRKSKFAPKVEMSLEDLMPDREDLEQLHGAAILSPESSVIRGQQDQRVREAIRSLPPHYRIVIVLRDMEGLTDEEVAEVTGLRPGTVHVRLHRARLFVRKELAKLNGPKKTSAAPRKAKVLSRPGHCEKMFAGLLDYLDGQLDDFSCAEMETHLNGCEPCKEFLRSLESTIESCRNTSAECPDPIKATALRKQLLTAYSSALASA